VFASHIVNALPAATQDSVEAVLVGFKIQYTTNQFQIGLAQNETASDLAQLLAVNSTIAGLQQTYTLLQQTTANDQTRVDADVISLANMQKTVALDEEIVAAAQNRLSTATSNLHFLKVELQDAQNVENQYEDSMLPVLDQSTRAAVGIIGEIRCTGADQKDTCNLDSENILAFWAINGCRITTGFVCSDSTGGFCQCPQFVNFKPLLPPTTGRDYALWSAGTLRTVVQDIHAQIAIDNSTVQALLSSVASAQAEYDAALLAFENAVLQLQSDTSTLASIMRQLIVDQGTLQTDKFALGAAKDQYESTVRLRDLLAARYASEQPALARTISKLTRDNLFVVSGAVNLASTIDCSSSVQCMDGPGGALTFFANLGCTTTHKFVCETTIGSCGC